VVKPESNLGQTWFASPVPRRMPSQHATSNRAPSSPKSRKSDELWSNYGQTLVKLPSNSPSSPVPRVHHTHCLAGICATLEVATYRAICAHNFWVHAIRCHHATSSTIR
jgi:hypothetical protein